jgi:hypothetical protein
MSENSPNRRLKIDPWAASSLLQKAIRRGEAELAKEAAAILHRHRGVAVFRRLCMIAFEDIGIGDIDLLQDVTRFATDKTLREILGPDGELIDSLCSRMAQATKDRSADYLYCAATKLETAIAEQSELRDLPMDRLLGIASNEELPLTRRAVAALLMCTDSGRTGPLLNLGRVSKFLDTFAVKPVPLHDAVLQIARARAHPFCLMLPLIWSRWWRVADKVQIADDEIPDCDTIDGIPLYTFDKHTSLGKRAIARFARENNLVADALRNWVPARSAVDVAEIAAFYADAAPVVRRLQWATGSLLSQMGLVADMTGAGCRFAGVRAVAQCVSENLADLNRFRRTEMGIRKGVGVCN